MGKNAFIILDDALLSEPNVLEYVLKPKFLSQPDFDLAKYVSDSSSEILSLNEEEKENKLVSPGFVVLPPITKAKTYSVVNENKNSENKDNVTMERKLKNSFTGMLEQLNEDMKINNSAKVMTPDTNTQQFEQKNKANSLLQQQQNRCEQHINEELTLYCVACQQPVCFRCGYESHKNHQIIQISVAAENARMQLQEMKRHIERVIARMRKNRKDLETNYEEVLKRINSQFQITANRLKRKEEEIVQDMNTSKMNQSNNFFTVQNHHELQWGCIDAIIKKNDDVKMLKEFIEVSPIRDDYENVLEEELRNEKQIPDLSLVHDEIEKVQVSCSRNFNEHSNNEKPISGKIISGSFIKKFDFKLDETTCHYSLKILPSGRTVEVVSVEKYQKRNSRCTQSMTYPGTLVEYFIGLSI